MISRRLAHLCVIPAVRPRQFLRALLLLLVLVLTAACLQADPLVMPIQPQSPLTETQLEVFKSPLTSGQPVSPVEPSSSKERVPGFEMYAEMLGLPYEEAERRLLLQAAMNEIEIKIAEAEPTYAGSWMQHAPVFGLVVAFTLPVAEGKALVAKYLENVVWADQVIVVRRPYTLAELTEMLRLVGETLQEVEGLDDLIYASGLDIPMGKVRLYTPDPSTLHEKLVREQVFQGTPIKISDIEFVFQAQPMAPAGEP